MTHFTTSRLFVAVAMLGALVLPIAAQAHGQRNDATKVTDAVILPPRKVLHFGKRTTHSAVERVGHVAKQIFR